MSTARGRSVHRARGTAVAGVDLRAGLRELVQRELAGAPGRHADAPSRRRWSSRRRSPRCRRRSGRAPSCARPAAGRRRPRSRASSVPMPSIRAPISIEHLGRCRRSPARGRRCRSPSCRVASTAAMRMFSVAPTLGKSSQIVAPAGRAGPRATR